MFTVVPVSAVSLDAFGLDDDIREFVCSTPCSLLDDRRVQAVFPFDYATCREALSAEVRGGVLAPGQHGVCWE